MDGRRAQFASCDRRVKADGIPRAADTDGPCCMGTWTSRLKADPTSWLLAEGDPWVVYRTLIDILARDEADPEVAAAQKAVAAAAPVRAILDAQRPDGGWEAGTFCYSCSSQHQGDTMGLLSVLADFGITMLALRVVKRVYGQRPGGNLEEPCEER